MAKYGESKLLGAVTPGTKVAHWTVVREEPRRYGLRHLLCRCVCGTERAVSIGALRTGQSKSCSCQSKARKHGMSGGREYRRWQAMIQRCHNPKSDAFHNYGGRGIQVCQRWRDSFENYAADMGTRPAGATLDRIDNDGHYAPDNCRWATRIEQAKNTRWTHERRVEHGRKNAMKRWHPDQLRAE